MNVLCMFWWCFFASPTQCCSPMIPCAGEHALVSRVLCQRKEREKVWNEVQYCCENCHSSSQTDNAGKLNRYETRIAEEE